MRRELLAGVGMLLAASSVSYAQPTPTPTVPGYPDVKVLPVESTPAKPAATGMDANGSNLRQQLTENLKKAGYTDVKVKPDAFIVEAKNKTGDPVMMFLSPDSMTVFTAQNPKGQDTKTASIPPK